MINCKHEKEDRCNFDGLKCIDLNLNEERPLCKLRSPLLKEDSEVIIKSIPKLIGKKEHMDLIGRNGKVLAVRHSDNQILVKIEGRSWPISFHISQLEF